MISSDISQRDALDKMEAVASTSAYLLLLDAGDGDDVTLEGTWFLNAGFERKGSDLVITGIDGRVVIVRQYFDNLNLPDIRSTDGAIITGETVKLLAGPIAKPAFSQAVEIAQVEPIGIIETIEGEVYVSRVDGTQSLMQFGDSVFTGDIIITRDSSSVGIVFVDGSAFSLGESGRMVIDEMVYDPTVQDGKAAISLLQGAFTFVSGQIAKIGVDAMVVETPTATIGIRGTAIGGQVNSQGQLTIALTKEQSNTVGEVTVSTDAGFQTINQEFQALTIANRTTVPSEPFVMSPQQFGLAFGNAMKSLPNANQTLSPDVVREAGLAFQKQQAIDKEAEAAEQQSIDASAKAEAASLAADAAAAEAAAAEAAVKEMVASVDMAAQALAGATTPEEKELAIAALEAAKADIANVEDAAVAASAEAAKLAAAAETASLAAAGASIAAARARAVAIDASPEAAVAAAAEASGVRTHVSDQVNQQKQAAINQIMAAEKVASATDAKTATEAKIGDMLTPPSSVEEVGPTPEPAPETPLAPQVPVASSPAEPFVVSAFVAPIPSGISDVLENVSAIFAVEEIAEEMARQPDQNTGPTMEESLPESTTPSTYYVDESSAPVVDLDGGIDIIIASVGTYTLPDEIENLIFLAQEPVEVASTGLQASYYINTRNGIYSSYSPYKQTIDANIDFSGHWKDLYGTLNLPQDHLHGNEHFTVNWQGTIEGPITGLVTFYASHDDGARMKIDDEYVFNNWRPQGSRNYNSMGYYFMEVGKKYTFQAEMFENGGGDVMRLFWQYDQENIHIVDQDYFSYTTSEVVNYIGYGNALDNVMQGNDNGGTLFGSVGNDTLIGGNGADIFYGGTGHDTFVFDSASGAEDTIMDWMVGDKIDLTGIINSVHFIHDHDFSGTPGEIRFDAENQKLEIDTNADHSGDFTINMNSYSVNRVEDFGADSFEVSS